MTSSSEENNTHCWISYVNGHNLVTDNCKTPRREKLLVRGFTRTHPSFIPAAISGLCFQYHYDAYHREVRVNTMDMGLESILRHELVHKDTMYRELLIKWSEETGIPLSHLTVYNYTERKNKTMRPNAQIKVDLDEEFKGDGDWTDEQIKTHTIPTNPTMKRIGSAHHRIGNVLVSKRSFMLLDERRITTLEGPKSENGARMIFVALKYFDILEQKMYFVDWLRVKTSSITFDDIEKHIETTLIPKQKFRGGPLDSLYDFCIKMKGVEAKRDGKVVPKFQFYEEEAVLVPKQKHKRLFRVDSYPNDQTVDHDFYNGDMFVFQINRFHLLEHAFTAEKQQQQLLPIYEIRKQEFENKGSFWFCCVKDFIESLTLMTDIQINIRERQRWEQQWTEALTRQYINSEDGHRSKAIRRKISRSNHKWRVDSRTTFGMIRKRLGSHYRINPAHVEIWLDQKRMQWHRSLPDFIHKRMKRLQPCRLKFEIVAYNVRDLDEIQVIQQYKRHSSVKLRCELNESALFNFVFHLPSYPAMTATNTSMTMIYRTTWTAKDLIQSILNLMIGNQMFLSAFFGHIIKYIRNFELDEHLEELADGEVNIEIVRNLSPNRFLIVNERCNIGEQLEYHMNDEYPMHSKFEGSEFIVQLLAKNDPLVLRSHAQREAARSLMVQDGTEIGIDSKSTITYGLWVYIYRVYRLGSDEELLGKLRAVIAEGKSFKNLILRDIWPYLKINRLHSLSDHSATSKIENAKLEDTQDNLMKLIIESNIKFCLISAGRKSKSVTVQGDLLNRKNIGSSLTSDMWLKVCLPRQTIDDT